MPLTGVGHADLPLQCAFKDRAESVQSWFRARLCSPEGQYGGRSAKTLDITKVVATVERSFGFIEAVVGRLFQKRKHSLSDRKALRLSAPFSLPNLVSEMICMPTARDPDTDPWMVDSTMWLVTPEQTLTAASFSGLGEKSLRIPGVAVLTFSKSIVDRMGELSGLVEATWLGPHHHPYGTVEIVKQGEYDGVNVTLLVPPMGASPLACIVEDLASCGVRGVFLVCATWSLGPPVQLGIIRGTSSGQRLRLVDAMNV